MDILLALIVWIVSFRFIAVRFRTWVEADPLVIELPLPLWVYAIFAVIAAAPSAVIVVLWP